MCRQENSAGITLLEMLVVLAITAITLTLAAPSFSTLVANVRLKTATELLLTHLNFARSEAIKRNARVVLCKSANGIQCADVGGWEQGWMVFHDANSNAQVDPGEAILLHQAALQGFVRFSGNTNIAQYVSYTPDGGAHLVSGGFQSGTFTLCGYSDRPTEAREIAISKAGQARIKASTDTQCP